MLARALLLFILGLGLTEQALALSAEPAFKRHPGHPQTLEGLLQKRQGSQLPPPPPVPPQCKSRCDPINAILVQDNLSYYQQANHHQHDRDFDHFKHISAYHVYNVFTHSHNHIDYVTSDFQHYQLNHRSAFAQQPCGRSGGNYNPEYHNPWCSSRFFSSHHCAEYQ
ncbi:hypothetical protein H1R20_g13583, partial [Candolleomyces eurysporus]